VRFEQIVEELHIQLVVFNDQDGLRHSLPALFQCPCCGREAAFGTGGTLVAISYVKTNFVDSQRGLPRRSGLPSLLG
jgi:hypothetical protein